MPEIRQYKHKWNRKLNINGIDQRGGYLNIDAGISRLLAVLLAVTATAHASLPSTSAQMNKIKVDVAI